MCTTCQSAGWWKHLSYWFVSWSFSTANCVFHLFIYSLCKSKMFSGVIERQQNADAVQHFSWLWLDCQYGITWNIKYSLLVGRSGLPGFSRNDSTARHSLPPIGGVHYFSDWKPCLRGDSQNKSSVVTHWKLLVIKPYSMIPTSHIHDQNFEKYRC